jgi:hypothetical protein
MPRVSEPHYRGERFVCHSIPMYKYVFRGKGPVNDFLPFEEFK